MFACFRDINTDTITLEQVPILVEHTHLELTPLTPLLGHLVHAHLVHTHCNQDTYSQDTVPLVNTPHHQRLIRLIHPMHLLHLMHLLCILWDLDMHRIQVMFLYLRLYS